MSVDTKSEIKYLHVLQDGMFSNYFIQRINEDYNPLDHLFCVISKTSELKHLQHSFNLKIIKYDLSLNCILDNAEIKKYIKKAQRIYIHFLSIQTAYYLLRYMCKDTELYWMTWGADIYRAVKYDLLYDDETKRVLSHIRKRKLTFIKTRFIDFIKRRLIKKVNVICSPFDGDYEIIKQSWKTNATHELFSYVIPTQVETNISKEARPDWLVNLKHQYKYIVLLGNSADPTNNHLTILKKLHQYERKDFVIVAPLSYGNQEYAKIIDQMGKQLFNERYYSLFEYLNTNQYQTLLNDVEVAIFNHQRQQAGGNIETLLTMGKKVYMNNTSLYQFYMERSINVHLIEHLSEDSIFKYLNHAAINMKGKAIEAYSCQKVYDNIFK